MARKKTGIDSKPGVFRTIRAAARRSGTEKLTRKQIECEIAAYRREQKLKNAASKSRA